MSHHLTTEQISSFNDNGFLAIDQLLDDDELRPLEREYEELLDQVAHRLFKAGHVTSTYAGLSFQDGFENLLSEYGELHRYLNISLPLINGPVNPEEFVTHSGPALFHVLRNEKILDVVESIIGPEIYSSPVQQMRMKPSARRLDVMQAEHSNVGTTPWHQDVVVLMHEADDTDMLTVWVAVTEATLENGCLVSVPKSHERGELAHCPGKVLESEPAVPQDIVRQHRAKPLPVKRGGVILFNKYNLHSSLPNRTNDMRWSLDLRYIPIGQPTGRPAFPGFTARSRANPESELHDPQVWNQLWEDARQRILSGTHEGPLFNAAKWEQYSDAPICA